MTAIHHLNCGYLHAPPNPRASCHCLLLQDRTGLALVDTGIGWLDVKNPVGRLGQPLIDAAGFQFNEADTAVRQIEGLGFQADDVTHLILTHADPDHAGGVADFPEARFHLSHEELVNLARGNPRYVQAQFVHGPRLTPQSLTPRDWFGIEARPLDLGFESEVLLVPLFGHTLGHCGVAVQQGDRWFLHVGDAYYLRVEIERDDHPVSFLASQRADDDMKRRASLEQIRRLIRDHGDVIAITGYHDEAELAACLA